MRQQASAQYGFIAQRNRLHALLIVKLLRWRLRAQGYGSGAAFFDMCNAFPSTAWTGIDRTTLPLADEDGQDLLAVVPLHYQYHRRLQG